MDLEIKDIAIIISGVVTATATLFAVIITSYFNLKLAKQNIESQSHQNDKERKIDKIENIYLLFEKWEAHMDRVYLYYLQCCSGNSRYENMISGELNLKIIEPTDFIKLETLINIYTPEAIPKYSKVVEARERITDCMMINPQKSSPDLEKLHEEQRKFKEECKDFKTMMSKIINNLL